MTSSVSMSAARRFRYTLAAGATAVVIGAGFTVIGVARSGDTVPDNAAANAPLTTQAPVDLGGTPDADLLLDEEAASLPPSVPPSASPSPSKTASPKASPSTRKASPKASSKPAETAKAKKTKAASTSAPSTSGSVLDQVLAHINAAREDEGLDALTLDSDLSKAAAIHNQLMIDGCGLSHQCSGEGGIGDRFSAQGVKWSSAGENIGYGSAGSSDSAKVGAANGLTDSMLAETPPNDGHRKNLLSKDFERIGLSVVRDSKGMVWMTQDFVG
ncbi:CAP domain-containing protein [Actinoplanes sp. RD1]|uniref:CAP domain-containing protein n=1 Tax=Actinoplanes sp. RD1 TaxID=3064538 RepID=UPI0027403832|nr:CAP domain-containing protein [Actinoplanes sp. RD1]